MTPSQRGFTVLSLLFLFLSLLTLPTAAQSNPLSVAIMSSDATAAPPAPPPRLTEDWFC